MPDDHLVTIETKLSFQEDLLDELNSIIIRQQKEIDSLKHELLLLQKKITIINIVTPRPTSSTYSLSIISFKNGLIFGKINKVIM